MQHIVAWAAELGLGGFSKPGHPGIVVCEGLEADVEEYTTRLRALRVGAVLIYCADNWQNQVSDSASFCSGQPWLYEATSTVS